jgi:SAM-dependent methyltransferase
VLVLHEESRGRTFGEEAEAYDRARPSYPDALIADLVADRPRRVLDIGCGTGIAARLFAAQGCAVHGVDPDPRMAAIARRHGIDVDVSRFETWEAPSEAFDLVICAQAWHWIDPDVGPAKCGAVLSGGGRFAAFWNFYRHDRDMLAALNDVYERHVPGLAANTLVLGTSEDLLGPQTRALEAAGCFEQIGTRSYPWERRYTADEWLAVSATQSDHLALPAGTLRALLEDVAAEIGERGGTLTVAHEALALTAVRRIGR